MKVATSIIDNVFMVSSHRPMTPIAHNPNCMAIVSFQLLLTEYDIKAMARRIIGHGVYTNNFSITIRKFNSGTKKFSIDSPCTALNEKKILSISLLICCNELEDSCGNLSNQFILN